MNKNYEFFEIKIENKIANVILNNPAKRNALTINFWKNLPEIINQIDENVLARAIILSAKGSHFSSGLDLSLFGHEIFNVKDSKKNDTAVRQYGLKFQDFLKILQDAISSLENCRLPVIAAIQGACIGGGLDLVSACDIRMGTKDCYFSILESRIGLVADVGTFPRLVKLVPEGLIKELAYTGRNFYAEEAKEAGFLNKICNDKYSLLEECMATAQLIANNAPLTVHGCKRAINFTKDHSTQEGLNWVSMWNAAMLNSNEIHEGLKALQSKKSGDFSDLPKKNEVL